MSFTAPKLTNAGKALYYDNLGGDSLQFTTIKLGDGALVSPIATLTALVNPIVTIAAALSKNTDYVDISGSFSNAGLAAGFYWREIGIFAANPNYPNDRTKDILYCYQNAFDTADYIPLASVETVEKHIIVPVIVGDATSVTCTLDGSAIYATLQDLAAKQTEIDAKIPKSLATAVSQFLVSTAAGAWAVKTIAEIKTLLGLGSAAYTASSDYATAAQGTKADGAIPRSLGTAADQALISTGAGTWAVKTLAQIKTWLNLGSAAYLSAGTANGVATLDSGGKVPSVQLPSYVDDVLEYSNFASFPATGENGKIYVALDTNLTYRWSGTVYVEISQSLALGETSGTAYRGDRGKTAYDHSQTSGNPHGTTPAQIGAAAVTLTGIVAPTTSTVGIVGQFYFDSTNVVIYQCTIVAGSIYTWKPVVPKWKLIQTYDVAGSYTFTVPAGVTEIGVFMKGGGASGAAACGSYSGSYYQSVASGGASGYAKNLILSVTPGANIAAVVGVGGARVASSSFSAVNGNPGGTTSFNGVTVAGGECGIGYCGGSADVAVNGVSGGQGSDAQGSASGAIKAPTSRHLSGAVATSPYISNAAGNIKSGGFSDSALNARNMFDDTRHLSAGGYGGQTIIEDITGEKGGNGAHATNGNATAQDATGHGNGGGGAEIYWSASGTYTATSGAGTCGAIYIYAR